MLLSYSYDEHTTYEIEVPDDMFEAAQSNDPGGKAALALALYIQEENWEALELIAEWMHCAADKGNEEAEEWLEDYYFDDGACDPYS